MGRERFSSAPITTLGPRRAESRGRRRAQARQGRAQEGPGPPGARARAQPSLPPGGAGAAGRARAGPSPGSASRPAARSRPRVEATQSRSPTQRRWRRRQRRCPRGRSARALRAHRAHPGQWPGCPPAGLRWRRQQRPEQAATPSAARRRGRRCPIWDPRTPARLAAGPWLLRALTFPERTRGDTIARSARPPVLPPPPRPPQRRCRHLVSRAGTARCACAGTASEGARRGRAAILSVAESAGFQALLAFVPLPILSLPAVACGFDGGRGSSAAAWVWA